MTNTYTIKISPPEVDLEPIGDTLVFKTRSSIIGIKRCQSRALRENPLHQEIELLTPSSTLEPDCAIVSATLLLTELCNEHNLTRSSWQVEPAHEDTFLPLQVIP